MKQDLLDRLIYMKVKYQKIVGNKKKLKNNKNRLKNNKKNNQKNRKANNKTNSYNKIKKILSNKMSKLKNKNKKTELKILMKRQVNKKIHQFYCTGNNKKQLNVNYKKNKKESNT